MSNNALGCSSLWVADCELRCVGCGISRTKAASVLASIWGSTGECAVAVMSMDVHHERDLVITQKLHCILYSPPTLFIGCTT